MSNAHDYKIGDLAVIANHDYHPKFSNSWTVGALCEVVGRAGGNAIVRRGSLSQYVNVKCLTRAVFARKDHEFIYGETLDDGQQNRI